MSEPAQGEFRELIAVMNELIPLLSRPAPEPTPTATQSASGNSAVNINAGGIALWIAVTACLMMAALNVALLVFLARLDRESSEYGHQLNAIYMMAPHLKPEDPPP